MASLSDTLLDSGCALHVEAAHSESVRILDGPDAGKTAFAVKENMEDLTLSIPGESDPRAKRILRFRNSSGVPAINDGGLVETDDGRKWTAIRAPQNDYLFTDFIIMEKLPKDK